MNSSSLLTSNTDADSKRSFNFWIDFVMNSALKVSIHFFLFFAITLRTNSAHVIITNTEPLFGRRKKNIITDNNQNSKKITTYFTMDLQSYLYTYLHHCNVLHTYLVVLHNGYFLHQTRVASQGTQLRSTCSSRKEVWKQLGFFFTVAREGSFRLLGKKICLNISVKYLLLQNQSNSCKFILKVYCCLFFACLIRE